LKTEVLYRSDLMFPPPIQKIFLQDIFLYEIRRHPDSISGCRIRKGLTKAIVKSLFAIYAMEKSSLRENVVR